MLSKKLVEESFAKYDNITVNKTLIELFNMNHLIATPSFSYHMLVRFCDAGESELMLVAMFQYYIEMLKTMGGSELLTIIVGWYILPRWFVLIERTDMLATSMQAMGLTTFTEVDDFVDKLNERCGGLCKPRGVRALTDEVVSADHVGITLKATLVISGIMNEAAMAEFENAVPKEMTPAVFTQLNDCLPHLPEGEEELIATLLEGRPRPTYDALVLNQGSFLWMLSDLTPDWIEASMIVIQ
jgi:hypothetical protein